MAKCQNYGICRLIGTVHTCPLSTVHESTRFGTRTRTRWAWIVRIWSGSIPKNHWGRIRLQLENIRIFAYIYYNCEYNFIDFFPNSSMIFKIRQTIVIMRKTMLILKPRKIFLYCERESWMLNILDVTSFLKVELN